MKTIGYAPFVKKKILENDLFYGKSCFLYLVMTVKMSWKTFLIILNNGL